MNDPKFSAGGGAYTITWGTPEHVSITFERLQVDRREFSAEVRVTSTAPGASGLLHQRRLNLDSDMAVDRFAAKLAKRTPGTGIAWDALLEIACLRVQEAHRVGKAPILLRDIEPPAEAGWLREPLALTRLPSCVFGDGSNLKSYLLLALGADITSGGDLLGLHGNMKLKVGYLDAEFDGWEHKKRLRRLVGEQMPDIVYIESQGSLRSQLERLQRIIRDEEIGFLLLDSVTFLCDGPPEDAESARAYFDALRQLGIGSISAAHVNRSNDTERPFGSVFWHNGFRGTWYVKKQQDAGGDEVTIGLFNKKSNVDRLMPPLGFRFVFEQDRTFIERVDVRDVPELAGQVSLKERMKRMLASGALTIPDLADELEAEVETVGRVARRYKNLFTSFTKDSKRLIALVQPADPDTVRTLSGGQRGALSPLSGGLSAASEQDQTWWKR